LCKAENEWETDGSETKRNEAMVKKKSNNTIEGADANAESKVNRALPLLWNDIQRAVIDKISLLYNPVVVPVDEPEKSEEKLQLGGF